MRPPICELCDTRFSPRDGALISFKPVWAPPEDPSDQQDRPAKIAVGHPENQGWFCPEHAEDAQAHVAVTLGEALQELKSPTAGPGAKQRRLFAEVAQTQIVAIAPSSEEGMQTSLIDVRKATTPVFAAELDNLGSRSQRMPMPSEPIYVGADDYRFSTSTSLAGNGSIHTINRLWMRDKNKVVARHIELVVVVEGDIKLIGTLIPEMHDGRYREFVITQDPDFAELPEAQDVVAKMVAVLRVVQFDPFDLEPDLVGVDLCGARLAGSIRFKSKALEWDITPTSVGRLEEVFIENLGLLAAALGRSAQFSAGSSAGSSAGPVEKTSGSGSEFGLGLELGLELERTTKRQFNPVDGSRPPHCPFDDRHLARGVIEDSGRRIDVEVERWQTHWSENNIANSTVSVTLGDLRGDVESMYLRASGSTGTQCLALKLSRPTTVSIIEAVSKIVASLDPATD